MYPRNHWFGMVIIEIHIAFVFQCFPDIKVLILYGIAEIKWCIWFQQYSMQVIFLTPLTIYGTAGKMLHLVSMFSHIYIYPSNDWLAMGLVRKTLKTEHGFLLGWIYWYEIVQNGAIHSSSNKCVDSLKMQTPRCIYAHGSNSWAIVQLKTI